MRLREEGDFDDIPSISAFRAPTPRAQRQRSAPSCAGDRRATRILPASQRMHRPQRRKPRRSGWFSSSSSAETGTDDTQDGHCKESNRERANKWISECRPQMFLPSGELQPWIRERAFKQQERHVRTELLKKMVPMPFEDWLKDNIAAQQDQVQRQREEARIREEQRIEEEQKKQRSKPSPYSQLGLGSPRHFAKSRYRDSV